MTIPTQKAIELPLLLELHRSGGSAAPKDLYAKIIQHFPEMSESERGLELSSGGNKFNNRVQWARNSLCDKGYIDRKTRGLWILTQAGIEAAKNSADSNLVLNPNFTDSSIHQPTSTTSNNRTLIDLVEEHDLSIRSELLDRVLGMNPYDFEELCGKLLRLMGFREVVVTTKSNDGGIDGHGRLRVGIVSVNASFQCKRYQRNNKIGRPVVDQVRGAATGFFEQAIIITTSSFTDEAREHSIRTGAIPVVLVDGDALVEFMIEHEVGINIRSFNFPLVDEDFFALEED